MRRRHNRLGACPRQGVLKTVVSPEELVTDYEARGAEDPEFSSPPRLFAHAQLVLGRLGLLGEPGTRLSERVEYRAEHHGVPDVAILGELGPEDRLGELGKPALERHFRTTGDPGGEQAVAREARWLRKGERYLAHSRSTSRHI
jgi:hypothetical protein